MVTPVCNKYVNMDHIIKSAETVHLILFCCVGDAMRCAVSANLKMVALNIISPCYEIYCLFITNFAMI